MARTVAFALLAVAAALCGVNATLNAQQATLLEQARQAAMAEAARVGSPHTVTSLNTTAYLGRWYEMYQGWTVSIGFGRGSFCATADYGVDPINASRITVANREHHNTITGPQLNVSGYAYQTAPATYPGRLEVVLHGDHSLPFPAPYWILKTGPIVDGQYDFAIVSDNMRLTLFVLGRNPAKFDQVYKNEVLTWLAENGFDHFWNKPVPIVQSHCTYFA